MNTLLSTDGETRTLKRIALESKPSMFTNFITSAQRLRLKSKILGFKRYALGRTAFKSKTLAFDIFAVITITQPPLTQNLRFRKQSFLTPVPPGFADPKVAFGLGGVGRFDHREDSL